MKIKLEDFLKLPNDQKELALAKLTKEDLRKLALLSAADAVVHQAESDSE